MKLVKPVAFGAAVVAAGLMTASLPAQAQDTRVIRVGNWVPMHHLIVRGILEPWARAIEAESDGSLKFEIMSSALARPPGYFDFRKGEGIGMRFGEKSTV